MPINKQMTSSCKDDLPYWLALTFVEDIGPVTGKRLLAVFRSPRKVFEASFGELRDIEDIKAARAKKIKEFDAWSRVEKEIRAVQRLTINVVTFDDRRYPEHLRQLDDAPLLLYTKGDFHKNDTYAIAIVGSRKMTDYGRRIAQTTAFDLASLGITVVSGMARGIDTTSHKGALDAGGRSIAVLGCGIDRPYPSENKWLFDALSRSGCVISEFPIGTPPNKEHFPRRNRLISGLSLGVLVVEATLESGSLITAHYALEQGKDVFAIPGNITSENSEGTNALIKRGAKLVQKTDDIIEELAPVLRGLLKSSQGTSERTILKSREGLEISDEEKAICNVLGDEPKQIDVIARETNVSPSALLGLLLTLEMKGIVKQTEGKRFYRV